jgi:Tetratricopeptide repeat
VSHPHWQRGDPSVAATLLRSVRSLNNKGLDFLRIASLLATAPIPPSLVASVFSIVDGLDEADALHRAALGFAQAEKASLSERSDENARTVHALVSRAIRFSERHTDRRSALGAGIISALIRTLPAVADIRTHQLLSLEVLHARELSSRNIDNVGLATLAHWVARHDFERGAYTNAKGLEEQVLEFRMRVLGEGHPDTLTSMHNLAATAQGAGRSKQCPQAARKSSGNEKEYSRRRAP